MMRFTLKVLGVMVLFTFLLLLIFAVTSAATSTTSFCKSCHEIKPFVLSWKKSPHREVHCWGCHRFRSPSGMVINKVRGISYVYRHFVDNPTVITRALVFEQNCISCHLGEDKKFPNSPMMTNDIVNHLEIVKEDKSCEKCHSVTGHENFFGLEERFK